MTITIAEAVDLIIDHRGRPTPTLSASGVQFVSAKNVFGGRLHLDVGQRFLSHELAAQWIRHEIQPGDVLLTSEAPLGEVAYFDGRAEICVGQRLFGLRARADVLDRRFLYYLLQSPEVQRRIRARSSGTTAQGIKQSELRRVELDLPPLPEQRQVSAVLGALDDKIDSNRRLADLLEEVAAALFKARFVDFIGTEDLDESEIGPIPRGWRVRPLAELSSLTKNSIQPAETPDQFFEHFSIPAFDEGAVSEAVVGGAMLSSKTVLPSGDVVLLSKLNPATKRVWWPRPSGAGIPVCSPEFLALVPQGGVPATYLYGVLASDQRFYDELLGHASGTTGSRQRVKPSEAMACHVLLPGSDALAEWDRVSRPMQDKSGELRAEMRTLSVLRDALLPKLISGEVRVLDTTDLTGALEVVGESAR